MRRRTPGHWTPLIFYFISQKSELIRLPNWQTNLTTVRVSEQFFQAQWLATCHQVATFLRLKLTIDVSFSSCYAAKDLSVKFKPTPYSDHDKQIYSSNIFAIGSFFLQGKRGKTPSGRKRRPCVQLWAVSCGKASPGRRLPAEGGAPSGPIPHQRH